MYFCIHILKRAREHIHNFKIYYYKICATWKINFSTLDQLHLYVINMREWGNMLWYLANDSWRFADDEEFNKKTNDNDLNLYYLVLLLFIQCEFVDLTFFYFLLRQSHIHIHILLCCIFIKFKCLSCLWSEREICCYC